MSDATLVVELTQEQKAAAEAQAQQDLAEWYRQSAQLAELKESEMALRNKVVQYYFPNGLKEGVNKATMPADWTMSVTGVINRKIDETVKDAIHQELVEKFQIDSGNFIKYKPEIDLPEYRQLATLAADSEKHAAIFKCLSQMIIMTPGSPQIKLVPPKKPKTKVVE